MNKNTIICVHCGDEYIPEFKEGRVVRQEDCYCPYCNAVVNGEKDTHWLPSIVGDDERKVRGFHEI